MKRKIYFIFLIVILFVGFLRPAALIYERKAQFFSPGYSKNYKDFQNAYSGSQYVKKNNPSYIPDETFESFMGGAFLKGVNPIMIVHEHPPLGRYIISFSILLFDNASTLILPLILLSLLGIFLISRLVFSNVFLALIPVAIFANEPLLLSKFIFAPLLEPIQLTFIVYAIYFFIKGMMSKKYFKWFLFTSVMLGFVISIRFFILGLVLAISMFLFFCLRRKIDRKFIMFIFSLPLSLVVLILSYTRTIQDGYSVFQVFSIQKYILFYHKSKLISPFSFWDLILFNRWHTWWGDHAIISDSEWIFIWPIAVILTFLFFVFVLRKRMNINIPEKIIFLWIGMYILLLSVGDTTTRYFLPLTPFLYILAVSFLLKLFKNEKANN